MLLAARQPKGPSRLRGCTALAASKDLKTWEIRPPLYAPNEWFTHECPDLFRMGKWWYLVFSEFSEHSATRYRISRSPSGPWLCPPDDQFDARAFYAAKTAGNQRERFVFGWLPTRTGENDVGAWNWGGNLVVHEVRQKPGGGLSVRMPAAVGRAFGRSVRLSPRPIVGQWQIAAGGFAVDATGRLSMMSLAAPPRQCMVEAKVTFDRNTAGCGLVVRHDQAKDQYYLVCIEPHRQRLVVDRWPRPGDEAFMLERPLAVRPGNRSASR